MRDGAVLTSSEDLTSRVGTGLALSQTDLTHVVGLELAQNVDKITRGRPLASPHGVHRTLIVIEGDVPDPDQVAACVHILGAQPCRVLADGTEQRHRSWARWRPPG